VHPQGATVFEQLDPLGVRQALALARLSDDRQLANAVKP
jgi:hypothetical protein